MRITVDIPDALYRELRIKAAAEKCSVAELILRGVRVEPSLDSSKRGRRVVLPLIRSKRPGTLDIDNSKIAELVPFP
jgi:hypothetical protein